MFILQALIFSVQLSVADPNFDLRDLWTGKYIESWPNNIELYYEKGEVLLDFIPNVLSWLIFTDKVVDIIKNLNGNKIQVYPVQISKKGDKVKCYCVNVVNVIESVAAFDWDKSEYISWEDDPEYIKYIRKIVLKGDKIYRNLDIFRLDESKNYIIVSERIKEEFEKEKIVGFRYTPLEMV
ncbi:MAG: imm11 family protein [Proteocatella sp.]